MSAYRIITEPEELDQMPEGSIIKCNKERSNPLWPDVFLHTGHSRDPWLHLDPEDRYDGENTVASAAVLRWHGDGKATVLWEPTA